MTTPITSSGCRPSAVKLALDVISAAILVLTTLALFAIPLVFLVLHGVASGAEFGVHIPLTDMWSGLTWSTLIASLVAACTTFLGSSAALLTMLVPRGVSRFIDVVALLPITLSPFVIASAFKTVLGRGSWWATALDLQSDFMGFFPMLLSFAVALLPFSYAISRVAFSRIDPDAIDAARVLGSHGLGLLRVAVLPRMRIVLPMSWMVVFVLAISDPVVPSLVGGRVPNAARMVWLQMTTLGDVRFAARVSLLMLVPTGAWGLLFLALLKPFSARSSGHFLSSSFSTGGRKRPSLPVGNKSVSRSLILVLIAAVVSVPVIQILLNASPNLTPNLQSVIGTTLVLALVSVFGAAIISASGMWLFHRLGRSHWIDALFGLAIAVPGATIGTGLATAYGPTSGFLGPVLPLSGASAPASGMILIVMSYLTIGAPLTYFSARAWTNLVPRRSLEMAMVLGASRMRAWRVVALPWLRNVLTLSLAIVIAVSAVSVAPVMWVTSPATALLVPHLFTLLDHTSYEAAFSVATAGSLVVLALVAVTFSTFSGRKSIFGGHR